MPPDLLLNEGVSLQWVNDRQRLWCQQSNRNVGMILMPQSSHDVTNFVLRQILDYWVTHLWGKELLAYFELDTCGDELMEVLAHGG